MQNTNRGKKLQKEEKRWVCLDKSRLFGGAAELVRGPIRNLTFSRAIFCFEALAALLQVVSRLGALLTESKGPLVFENAGNIFVETRDDDALVHGETNGSGPKDVARLNFALLHHGEDGSCLEIFHIVHGVGFPISWRRKGELKILRPAAAGSE